jgi:hypothetical protein
MQRAAARRVFHSQAIDKTVAGLPARGEDELAREGYQFYAEESAEFAAASLGAVSQAIDCPGRQSIR